MAETMHAAGGKLDPAAVDSAAERLLEAAPVGSEVYLFGSYARGTATADSDLDFLVVEPEPESPYSEMVRLRDVLRSSPVSVDVLVVSRSRFEAWRDKINTVVHEAARKGRRYARGA